MREHETGLSLAFIVMHLIMRWGSTVMDKKLCEDLEGLICDRMH